MLLERSLRERLWSCLGCGIFQNRFQKRKEQNAKDKKKKSTLMLSILINWFIVMRWVQYNSYRYCQRLQQMSTSSLSLRLDQLYRSKKISIKQLKDLLELLVQENGIVLTQRISILSTIMNFVVIATKQVKEEAEKFRYEVCFDPLSTENRKKRLKPSSSKKTGPRLAGYKANISLKEMLAQAVRSGLKQIDLSVQSKTPLHEPVLPESHLNTVVPPFQQDVIDQLSQDQSVISKEEPKLFTNWMTKERMMTYHKLLDITQDKEEEVGLPTLEKNKAVHAATSQKRTVKKRKTLARDEEIELASTGQINADKLTTKVKANRQLSLEVSLQSKFQQCNPAITDLSSMVSQLQLKLKQNPFFGKPSYYQNSAFMGNNMIEISDLLEQRRPNLQQSFMVNQQNNPSLTATLQTKLNTVLQAQFFTQEKISFDHFCEKRAIYREIKCQLFYQLLHMELPLQQAQPSTFSEIFIIRPNHNQ